MPHHKFLFYEQPHENYLETETVAIIVLVISFYVPNGIKVYSYILVLALFFIKTLTVLLK